MKCSVTDQGLLIPKYLLEGVDEVEIRQEQTRLVIVPIPEADALLDLGSEPIVDITDASIEHDRYLYGP